MAQVELMFEPGEEVKIKNLENNALVIGAYVSPERIKYDCAWFVNGDRKTEYFFEFELEKVDNSSKGKKLGFGK